MDSRQGKFHSVPIVHGGREYSGPPLPNLIPAVVFNLVLARLTYGGAQLGHTHPKDILLLSNPGSRRQGKGGDTRWP